MRRNNRVDRYQTSRRSRALDRDNYEPYTRGAVDNYEYGGEAYGDEDYDDYGYEDYGELGSNYDTEDNPDWGYDDYDGYPTDEEREDMRNFANSVSPEDLRDRFSLPTPQRGNGRLPTRPDFGSAGQVRPYSTKGSNIDTSRFREKAPDRLDFNDFNRKSKDAEDTAKYLEYIERYDSGDIDNYDMSKVQRRFANKAFWETFEPSERMIREYGSGNESTKWPLFEWRGGRWSPIIWRED